MLNCSAPLGPRGRGAPLGSAGSRAGGSLPAAHGELRGTRGPGGPEAREAGRERGQRWGPRCGAGNDPKHPIPRTGRVERGHAGAGVYRARKIPTAIASVGNAVLGTQPILARPVAEGSVQAPGHPSSPRAPNRTCRGKTRGHRGGGREGSCRLSAHGPSRVSASPLPRGSSRAVGPQCGAAPVPGMGLWGSQPSLPTQSVVPTLRAPALPPLWMSSSLWLWRASTETSVP